MCGWPSAPTAIDVYWPTLPEELTVALCHVNSGADMASADKATIQIAADMTLFPKFIFIIPMPPDPGKQTSEAWRSRTISRLFKCRHQPSFYPVATAALP